MVFRCDIHYTRPVFVCINNATGKPLVTLLYIDGHFQGKWAFAFEQYALKHIDKLSSSYAWYVFLYHVCELLLAISSK